jgi:hypothetical protein
MTTASLAAGHPRRAGHMSAGVAHTCSSVGHVQLPRSEHNQVNDRPFAQSDDECSRVANHPPPKLEPQDEYRRGRRDPGEELEHEYGERLSRTAPQPRYREEHDDRNLASYEQLPEVRSCPFIGFAGRPDKGDVNGDHRQGGDRHRHRYERAGSLQHRHIHVPIQGKVTSARGGGPKGGGFARTRQRGTGREATSLALSMYARPTIFRLGR